MPSSSSEKRVVSACPVCGGTLQIGRLACSCCDTRIDTTLPIPLFFRLPDDLQQFVLIFLRCRGNIREVEKALGISYPTVCKRLDLVNELLGNHPAALTRSEILGKLERGEISPRQATELLKGRQTP